MRPLSIVHLTLEEQSWANQIANEQYLRAQKEGNKNAHGLEADAEESLGINEIGSRGELAFAKYLGLVWKPGTYENRYGGDVEGFEVRTTGHERGRCLVRPNGFNHRFYNLVIERGTRYEIWGGILGKEAKQERWLYKENGRPPCYLVPREFLHPMKWEPGPEHELICQYCWGGYITGPGQLVPHWEECPYEVYRC